MVPREGRKAGSWVSDVSSSGLATKMPAPLINMSTEPTACANRSTEAGSDWSKTWACAPSRPATHSVGTARDQDAPSAEIEILLENHCRLRLLPTNTFAELLGEGGARLEARILPGGYRWPGADATIALSPP